MARRILAAAAALVLVGMPAALMPDVIAAGEPTEKAALPAASADSDLRADYLARSLAAKTAKDRYALGQWCREQGLPAESTAQIREAVRLDPDFAPAREALGDRRVDGRWMASDEAMAKKGLVRSGGRWVLPEEKAALEAPADERARLAKEEDRARRLVETIAGGGAREAGMAREALAGVEDRCKVTPLAFALRAKNRELRLLAAKELGRIGDRRALRPLVYRALRDSDADVRDACVDAARAFGDPELLAPFAREFLNAESAAVRSAAAGAMGRTGDLRGVQYLVYSLEAHGGGSRAHIYTANQLSFVQDFDVEVAQTAFIADPQVGILQDGASLDVACISNEWYSTRIERQAIVSSLQRLTKADIGDNAAGWKGWMKENREKLAAAR